MQGGESFEERLQLRPELSQGRPLRCRLQELCRLAGVEGECVSELLLAVSEAFSNAVRYGTTPPQACICVDIYIGPVEARITLVYEGAPFPQDPPSLPSIDSTGGRGRYLIALLTDEASYQFQEGKTCLGLLKRW